MARTPSQAYKGAMLRENSPMALSPVAAARQNGQKAARLAPLRFLVPFVRPHAPGLAAGAVAVFIAAASVLALGQVFRALVDDGLAAGNGDALDRALVVLIGLAVVLAAASYARLVLLAGYAETIVAAIRARVLEHLVRLDRAWFERNKTGDIISRITADTSVLQILIGTALPIALRNCVLVAGGLVMMLFSSAALSTLVLGLVPVIIGVLFLLGPRVRAAGRVLQDKIGETGAHLAESLAAIRDVHAFGRETALHDRYVLLNNDAVAAAWRYVRGRAAMSSVIIAVVFLAVGGLVGFGGHQVLRGTLSAGELSAFVFYALLVAGATGAISELYGDLQRAAGALERIDAILSARPAITAPAHPDRVTRPRTICLRDVTFAYPLRSDSAALTVPYLDLHDGQRVAIVGPSGSGKTTLFNLLLRLYDPTTGHITADGVDIRRFDPAAWRAQFALVAQDPVLFSTSIADNIAFNDPAIARDSIIAAAQTAQADGFIRALPQQYDTVLGERGARLSGGQIQRVAMARALVRHAPILLLDEATAHLDSETENALQHTLRTAGQNKTILIIAHRLSTVMDADRILVMDGGRIIDDGTHAELSTRCDLYQRLTRNQMTA